MTSITVRGTSHASVAPDRATLNLGLTHVATTASAALDVVAERSHLLAEVLAELAFADADWTTQGVAVSEEWEWHADTNTKVVSESLLGGMVVVLDPGGDKTMLKPGGEINNTQDAISFTELLAKFMFSGTGSK